ncbi:MAG: PKD domain-containing protein [Bacteroidia bacterium]
MTTVSKAIPGLTRGLLSFVLLLLLSSESFAQYCASGATSTFDSNIGLVQLNTINNSTLGVCATYSDFTSMSTNLTVGNSYTITVTAGTCGGNFTKYGKAYIDYNHDFDFLDSGEEIFGFGPAPATNTFSQSITVPFGALLGNTRLRVVVLETSSLAGVNSCGTFTWGETEDYTVNILPSAPNDMGATAIISPNSGCNLSATESVTITAANFGTNTQTAWTASYRINGGPIVTEPMTGNLASGGSMNYTFLATANLSTPGTYTIKAWVNLATDAYHGNDTTTKIVTAIPGINTFPYYQDFESGNGGWLSGGTANSWAYGTPAKNTIIGAASGTKAYVTGGLGTTDYNNNEQSYVLGPCFDLSSLQNPWFSCKIWWNSEFSWDGTNLQYSTNFGTTWQNVGLYLDPGNWYNDNTIVGNPGGSGEGWTGGAFGNTSGSGGYLTAAHRLDGLAGVGSVRFRLTFASDGSVTDDGIAFDDVRIAEGPVCNLGPDTLICGGDSLVLDAGPFAAFQWSPGGQTTRYKTINMFNTGMHIVKVTDVNGFYDFDSIFVNLSNPLLNIGPDSSICPGDSVLLDAQLHNGATYVWNTNATSQSIYALNSGTYWVEITDSVGCQKTDSMHLTVLIPPSLNLGNDTTVCSNTPVVLNAGFGPTGTVYQWNSGANTQVLVVTSSGQYSASVTTPGGCAAVDTVQIFHYPSPSVSLGPNRTECGAYTLDAGPGATSYHWSTNATSQTISNTTGGNYGVTVTNQFGCVAIDDVTITMGTVPTVSLGADTLLCNGQSLPLNAGNSGGTYLWSTGATTQSINVSAAGTYIVNVTNVQGCTGRDTITVSVSSLAVNLGPNTSICDNGTQTLNAGNPGMTYAWSTGANTQMVTVSQPGTYSVTVTDQLGCSAGDVIILSQVPGVYAGISAPATGSVFFPVQFTDVSTGPVNQWFWDFGDGITSTQQNPSHTFQALGQFNVMLIVTDGFCRDTTYTLVDVNTYVGVDEGSFANQVSVYPNPSAGVFHLILELKKRSDLTIKVSDLTGKVLHNESIRRTESYRGDVDLGDFAKGVYILEMEANGNRIFRKLILQ